MVASPKSKRRSRVSVAMVAVQVQARVQLAPVPVKVTTTAKARVDPPMDRAEPAAIRALVKATAKGKAVLKAGTEAVQAERPALDRSRVPVRKAVAVVSAGARVAAAVPIPFLPISQTAATMTSSRDNCAKLRCR